MIYNPFLHTKAFTFNLFRDWGFVYISGNTSCTLKAVVTLKNKQKKNVGIFNILDYVASVSLFNACKMLLMGNRARK